ncbi:hypothetical protein GQ53DRAFT_747525 [Thozetella sp. PMI_491]|nr:hypothetical protein GQ53DRAFT_747525 [Thozetella sp. PMI_491]
MRPVALARAIAPSARLILPGRLQAATSTTGTRLIATDSAKTYTPAPSDLLGAAATAPLTGTAAVPQPSEQNPYPRTQLPYHVTRTFSNNLPVYEKKSRSNPETVQWTQIRRIDGGMQGLRRLKADLETHLGFTEASANTTAPEALSTEQPLTRVRPPRRKRNERERKKDHDSIKINPTTSHIIIPGRHKGDVVSFLVQQGF